METTLQNGALTLTVSSLGAEMRALSANGIAYLWSGDAAYWSGIAPNLFPIVGALRGGKATSAAGEVALPKHGLIRKASTEPVYADGTKAVFRLCSDEATLAMYPYPFVWEVAYTLTDEQTVEVAYTVRNTGDRPMPYCLGGHPAFHVPLTEGERFEDTVLEWEQTETLSCPQVNLTNGLIADGTYNRLATESRCLPLHHVLFRGDALIFERPRSRWFQLRSQVSGHGVRVTTAMPFFGVWTMGGKDSPFVCLEPWTGMGTRESEDDVFEHKLGMTTLAPGEVGTHSFTITVF